MYYRYYLSLFVSCLFSLNVFAQNIKLENDAYKIYSKDKTIIITKKAGNISRVLNPQIDFYFSDLAVTTNYENAKEIPYPVLGWKKNEKDSGLTNPKDIARKSLLEIQAIKLLPSAIEIKYKSNALAVVSCLVTLPNGNESPIIELNIQSKRRGYYAATFKGLPQHHPDSLSFLYQPLLWSWKRFPQEVYYTPESYCTTAASFVNTGSFTEGIAPDVSEIPYRYATLGNSRFAINLRNDNGKAQPSIMFPVLGSDSSLLKKGQKLKFKMRYFIYDGTWQQALPALYNDVLHYKLERQNALVSLNQTINNMLDFAMNDLYGGWIPELKGSDYQFDVPGSVKNVSAMHALALAMLTGDKQIYTRRALPMMEYMMSREKYLFSIKDGVQPQNPSHFLTGPCAEIGELSGLHILTNGQTSAFYEELKRIFGKPRKLNLNTETGGGSWQDYLAKYRVSKDKNDLLKAEAGANDYLKQVYDQYSSTFKDDPGLKDKQAAFSTDFGYRIYDLTELFEQTQNKRFLDAAVTGARQLLLWTRSNPMAPDSNILVNQGGKVNSVFPGKRLGNTDYGFTTMDMTSYIQEQKVPAWHTSLAGLLPEQPSTYMYGPVMLSHHAAWLLRLGSLAKDSLLINAGRNAILGRYSNFPGYYFTSLHTNVYQQYDYPLHPYIDIKYNATFYNHIWPHLALLTDFLVTDFHTRSLGKINFSSVYAPGYAFLTSKVYGHKQGDFFSDKDVNIWMPRNAIQSASVAFNYLCGIKDNDFWIALANTSNQGINEKIRLNPSIIPWNTDEVYQVEIHQTDGSISKAVFVNGELSIKLKPQGLTAFKIKGLKVDVPFKNLNNFNKSIPENRFSREVDSSSVWGTTTAMIIQTFSGFADFYLFSDRTEKNWASATLYYKKGNSQWNTISDISYPFEFDVNLTDPAQEIYYKLKIKDINGVEHESVVKRINY
ncbi:hypothetical protein [Pedobacter puniceum]|uniref:Uncharacterized protein n=1 Tax=Pedobacter puniceum TaxID=2666136 RepID=A0A7K0FLU2_9SPHI|nr:hypothetical protein [Pedobacter puniceum]MRX46928.1 hypothetical protein [Pedobacter puniceum]